MTDTDESPEEHDNLEIIKESKNRSNKKDLQVVLKSTEPIKKSSRRKNV